ncbi:glucan endo-1,3-beta-glucosidase 12 [Neltuma alba]|uniref:glucan endo-1,3-beta-glucosidase 12 n=1 Tax=Neltuma alba TaxID=207710 RepID=UPI0010A30B08|nr:glucan endo-1,3-beta-glucosidase 12 [Prosopis alba]
MATAWTLKLMVLLLFLSMTPPKTVYGEDEQWCIADEQTPDEELQAAVDWACGKGGADCSKIQAKQSCFFPNTMRSHASFAFNSYFQKFKHSGGSCYFRGAAIITQEDPSYGSCHYDLIPDSNHQ